MLRVNGIVEVDANGVARILALEENHFTDLKAREITGASLVVHTTAFANGAGGEIYVGVDEVGGGGRAWRGFDTVEDANGHVQAIQGAFEGNNLVTVSFLRGAGVTGFVLHLIIEKSREIVETVGGDVYVRVSAQKLPVKLRAHAEIERLRLDKGLASYEDMPLPDVAEARVTDSHIVTEFMIEAVPVSEAQPWLSSQQLLVDGAPTVAAVLLFDDEPQVVLPKRSAIKVLRYKSSSVEGLRDQMESDPLTFEGPLTTQIRGAVQAVIEIVQGEAVQTAEGLAPVRYPPETLHEIITNAVLHRDYSIATDVQVRIFDNRVEVESPGKLPGHITKDNILDEQFARNGKIVRLVNKFPNPPNKDVGEGLNTAFQKMRDLGLKPPILDEEGNRVVVQIRHERLASYEEQIIEHLLVHGEIKNSGARELTGEGSENTMKRVFEKMMEAGEIYRDPDKKGSATTYLLTPDYLEKRRRGEK
jgi:ATP-dependent DNA helicase RecG